MNIFSKSTKETKISKKEKKEVKGESLPFLRGMRRLLRRQTSDSSAPATAASHGKRRRSRSSSASSSRTKKRRRRRSPSTSPSASRHHRRAQKTLPNPNLDELLDLLNQRRAPGLQDEQQHPHPSSGSTGSGSSFRTLRRPDTQDPPFNKSAFEDLSSSLKIEPFADDLGENVTTWVDAISAATSQSTLKELMKQNEIPNEGTNAKAAMVRKLYQHMLH